MMSFLVRLGSVQKLLRALCALRSLQATPSYGCVVNNYRVPASRVNALAITKAKGAVIAVGILCGVGAKDGSPDTSH